MLTDKSVHFILNLIFHFSQVTLAVVILFANGLILTAIKRNRALRKAPYLLMGHLAVADVLFGIGLTLRFLLIAMHIQRYIPPSENALELPYTLRGPACLKFKPPY